jgi:hypothetical protein
MAVPGARTVNNLSWIVYQWSIAVLVRINPPPNEKRPSIHGRRRFLLSFVPAQHLRRTTFLEDWVLLEPRASRARRTIDRAGGAS